MERCTRGSAMSTLSVIFIDVGWGDSILIETVDDAGDTRYALVDCNDTPLSRSSFLFVKRYLERHHVPFGGPNDRVFDFILLTHGHADHEQGLKAMMQEFRTDWFWYPKSVEHFGLGNVLRYANHSAQTGVIRHQAIDDTKVLDPLGDVALRALWPPHTPGGPHDSNNENNNSVALLLTLDQVSFLLTGDLEAGEWTQLIQTHLPIPGLALFQSPHHGARNGMFDGGGNTPWLDALPQSTRIAMSSHIRPHGHPAPEVVQELDNRNRVPFRTDEHYHLFFRTDGTLDANGEPSVTVEWTHG